MKHFLTLIALLVTSLSFGQESCPNLFDSNSNGAVDIEDFLAVLSLFSDVDSDSDGIWDSQDDCIDLEACNYAASPSEPCAFIDVLGECGGGCEGDGDGDGICDDEDDCVGVVDECGVCNGPGPTQVVIEDITILYDSVFMPLDNDWYVFPISSDTTFSYICPPSFSVCGDAVSYQGYDYATVLIGEQCWFAENLRNENYDNGDAIPSNLSASNWVSTTEGASAVYGEGSSVCASNYNPEGDSCDEDWSLSQYGRLYNWYAVNDSRGLCPSGWHIPTDAEWMTLEMALGMSEEEANLDGGTPRGADQGTQMKTEYGWHNGGNGTNSSGFSGLAGGFRRHGPHNAGKFFDAGVNAYFWSSSPVGGTTGWMRGLGFYTGGVQRIIFYHNDGLSIRCVRDAE